MIRTYKYRLYPNRQQEQTLDFMLWQMRTVYNDALNERRWAWERSRRGVTYQEQWARFKQARYDFPDTIGYLNATSTQQMLRRLDKALAAFFRRIKAGEEPGYPRFKSRSRFKSLEYRHGDGCKLNGNRLYVQRVGDIKVKLHRPLPEGATIKHVILKRNLDRWHVSLMLDIPDPEPLPETGQTLGIDVGLHHLLAFSNGVTVENPRWLRKSLMKLRTAQRHLSRCQKGSNRRRKAARRVAAIHEQIANQRLDFWHKTTRSLVGIYDTIAIEDLNLSFMTRNGHLALSAHDAALGTFRQLLTYKAEEAGRQLVAVKPNGTSQACSVCGVVVRKNLSIRVHRCDCGLILDRDVNAARNILYLARTGPSGHNLDAGSGAPRSSPL
jgi:putative transposase